VPGHSPDGAHQTRLLQHAPEVGRLVGGATDGFEDLARPAEW
jgi:hypothetical protein